MKNKFILGYNKGSNTHVLLNIYFSESNLEEIHTRPIRLAENIVTVVAEKNNSTHGKLIARNLTKYRRVVWFK